MKYIVLETQTNSEGVVSTLVNICNDQNEADSKYHSILSYAAVSTLSKHCAFILTDTGRTIKSDAYIHDVITIEDGDMNGNAQP